jgi:hypothetical protein
VDEPDEGFCGPDHMDVRQVDDGKRTPLRRRLPRGQPAPNSKTTFWRAVPTREYNWELADHIATALIGRGNICLR